jgi:hypothetical protein
MFRLSAGIASQQEVKGISVAGEAVEESSLQNGSSHGRISLADTSGNNRW